MEKSDPQTTIDPDVMDVQRAVQEMINMICEKDESMVAVIPGLVKYNQAMDRIERRLHVK